MSYPAKKHALRVASLLPDSLKTSLVYVASTASAKLPYSDMDTPFRQNRYFTYLTGAHDLADSHIIYDVAKNFLTLYIPPVDADEVMWSGLPLTVDEAAKKYNVDSVKVVADAEAAIATAANVVGIEPSPKFPRVQASEALLEALDEARVIKDADEIALMKRASEITDNCHLSVMSSLPIEKSEGHIHAEFVYHSIRQGSKHLSYDPICCAGTHCGTLHYVKNDKPLDGKLLVLIDAGAEWQNYAADVTRTWPISGEWTKECLEIYNIVLDMQAQAMTALKPGIEWEDLHMLTHRILIEHFLQLGIFTRGSVDEILESGISAAFYPHGLGHMLGLEVHDTAGHANYSDPNPLLRYLRIRRKLQENMVVTVEPGCYFNEFLLKPVFDDPEKAKYIDRKVLEPYWAVGGVRIEDDVLITKDGHENFTKITKDPQEISKIIKKGEAGNAAKFVY